MYTLVFFNFSFILNSLLVMSSSLAHSLLAFRIYTIDFFLKFINIEIFLDEMNE